MFNNLDYRIRYAIGIVFIIGSLFGGLIGYDLKNIPSDQLRKYIGYCPQKIQLFTGTILENIGTGN